MFCPQCRSEYREGFTRCAECGVDLIVESPPQRGPSDTQIEKDLDPVVVFTSANAGETALVKSLLEASSVAIYSVNDFYSTSDWRGAREGIIAVPRHQEELAREVLREYRGREPR
jgi:hypothetical protein